ncbi:hypothetical protein PHSC3_001348 [Chlamydiales bacterium STE3]|nr:hypothetical protein PHSC3_001348 [Chlamydiales bacterium STE3]
MNPASTFSPLPLQHLYHTSKPESLNIDLVYKELPGPFAKNSASMEEALLALRAAGYQLGDVKLTPKLSQSTGESFWDITINDQRIVYYVPGGFVQPHYHDIIEEFEIQSGGCYVWLSQDEGKTWEYNYCGKGKLTIPGKTWHCLVAGSEGLCMHVYNDQQRSINWLDQERSSKWAEDLKFKVTIQELAKATQEALH